MARRKLVIIGLDGADWSILDPLLGENALPGIADAIRRGSRARLRSTVPALTAPAWTSIFTGVNPGKHGLFDFFKPPEGGNLGITTSADNRVPYVWELMSQKKIIAFNIPWAYPPRAGDNALLVCGFGTPSSSSVFTSPESLSKELLATDPAYAPKPPEADRLVAGNPNKSAEEIVPPVMANLESKKKAALRLLSEKEWDLAIVVFSATDWLQHHYLEEFLGASKKSDSAVGRAYCSIDSFVGAMAAAGHDIIIVSDHGFRPTDKDFYVNSFLMSKGLISMKRERPSRAALRSLGLTKSNVLGAIPPAVLKALRKANALLLIKTLLPERHRLFHDIDFEKTGAFLHGASFGIYLKDPERAQEIAALLESAEDGSGNRPIIRAIRREELYHGPETRNAPNLLLIPSERFMLKTEFAEHPFFNGRKYLKKDGAHAEYGVFISSGDGFIKRGRLGDQSLLGITPTILAYHSLEIPAYMDAGAIPVLPPSEGARKTASHSVRAAVRAFVGSRRK